MAYTVLARRYRSQDFDEVIGQEPIARTLRKAIDTDRVAHAYLFCGTRGVGKTSMARIFAKALNLSDELTDREAIDDAIMRGDDIDVIEIDGASNRGVEEARELISKSIYRPARCVYKIYIIDEVHMLTREAFNALLKTMEEPPAHVKFILCTTEPFKVPATIQSRCQRFDFRNISSGDIAGHLQAVLKTEKVKAEEAVVLQIARLANGSMRDALSLLDRLLAANEKKLTVGILQEMLGLPDQAIIDNLINALAEADPAEALMVIEELVNRGNSLDQVIENLIERLRGMMIIRACGADASGAIDLVADDIEHLKKQAGQFDLAAIVHMIVLLENVQRTVKSSATGRALFEAAVVRLALAEKFADAASLIEKGGVPTLPSLTPSQQKKKPVAVAAVSVSAPPPPTPPPPSRSTTPAAATSAPTASATALNPVTLRAQLEARAADDGRLEMMLDHLTFEAIDGQGTARVTIDDATQFVQTKNNLPWLESIITDVTGAAIRIDLRISDEQQSGQQQRVSATEGRITRETREAASNIPLVRKAMEVLEMRLIDVEESSNSTE